MTLTTAEKITSAIKQCITSEMVEEGILSDVETFIPSYRLEDSMDLPAVWLFEHPTTLVNQKTWNLLQLTTPFEFVCVEYDDDIEQAEIKGKNLAWRVGSTILKNKDFKIDNCRVFNKIEFKTMYPVGEVQIQGKMNRVPATSIVFDVYYMINCVTLPKSYKAIGVTSGVEVVAEELYKKNRKK